MRYLFQTVLITENEDDLLRLLNRFNSTAKSLNMVISASKTTLKMPIRCKLLFVDDKIIQQETRFKYVGIELSGYGDVEAGATNNKSNGDTRMLKQHEMEKQTHMGIETKTRIYKSVIRPVMTYTVETRPDTSKTKKILETNEMKVFRKITGKTLMDRERNENIRTICKINKYINRMNEERIVKITRDKSPLGKRDIGRLRKRWCANITVNQR